MDICTIVILLLFSNCFSNGNCNEECNSDICDTRNSCGCGLENRNCCERQSREYYYEEEQCRRNKCNENSCNNTEYENISYNNGCCEGKDYMNNENNSIVCDCNCDNDCSRDLFERDNCDNGNDALCDECDKKRDIRRYEDGSYDMPWASYDLKSGNNYKSYK